MANGNTVQVQFPLDEDVAQKLKSIQEVTGIGIDDHLRVAAQEHVASEMSSPGFQERLKVSRKKSQEDVDRLLRIANPCV